MAATRVANQSIPLKEGMTAGAHFKETEYPKWKLEVASWNTGGPLKIYRCKHSFEITVVLKWKISVEYIVHATMDGYKCSSEIDRYINTWLKKRGWLELFLGSNTVTFKGKIFINNISFLDHSSFYCFCESGNSWSYSM